MTSWDIYWLTRMDYLQQLMFILAIILGVLSLVAGIIFVAAKAESYDEESEGVNISKKIMTISIPATLVLMSIASLLPSTKELAAIIIIPKIANAIETNQQIKKIPENLITLANDWIKELGPIKK